MNLKPKYWVLSISLGLVLCLVLPHYKASTNSPDSDDAKILHVLNRIAFGPRPRDMETVKAIGVEAYIQSQLTPASIPEPQTLTQELISLQTLQLNPVQLRTGYDPQMQRQPGQKPDPEAQKTARKRARTIVQQAIEGRLARAVASPRQLQEVMVDFWYNHFNVFAGKGLDRLWVGSYEEQAIRPYALGKFRDILGATAKHPAMLFYLDNWQNTAPNSSGARGRFKGLNENYARELMELHTLGVDGGYTQQDVIALARILTGWGFPRPRQPNVDSSGFYFDPSRHDFSDKVFLGQTIKGSGITEGEQALDILARHPATAHHISYQLAQYFVADNPPQSLVNNLAKRFLDTDGDIRAVLDTLFHSPEFFNSNYYNTKFKTPYQYVISALRATDTQIKDYRRVYGIVAQLGMPLYGYLTPDGYKNTQEAWLNPDALLRRISFVTILAADRFPGGKPMAIQQLDQTLGNNLSAKTKSVVESSPSQLRAALILGSPEFMKH